MSQSQPQAIPWPTKVFQRETHTTVACYHKTPNKVVRHATGEQLTITFTCPLLFVLDTAFQHQVRDVTLKYEAQ